MLICRQLAAAGHPVAASVASAAGRALGRMIAASANLAMLNTIVLSGEGIGLWPLVTEDVRAAIRAERDPDAADLNIVVDDAGFSSWARGAAAVAIQDSLGRLSSLR